MNLTLKTKIYEKFRTQSDAAMCFQMREDRLSQIIHGRRTPTDEEKRTISERLKTDEAELFLRFVKGATW
jgi:hypothetical protein